MPKSSLLDMTNRRPKEPFDPSLETPVALTPDQLEKVVGSLFSVSGPKGGNGGTTTGAVSPIKPVSILKL